MPKGIYKRKPFTKEHKSNMGINRIGNEYALGSKRTEEVKKKMSISKIGNENALGSVGYWKGKKRIGITGERCHFWKGGISTYERKLYLNGRRRALKKGAEGSHTQGEWELLKRQYGYQCCCCGETEPKITLTEDHIVPLSKGGSDYIENIQPLCRGCNCSKHTEVINYLRKD